MVELPITTTTFAIAIASATATSQWNVRFLMQSSPNKSSENVSKGFWHNGSYCEAMTRSQELWQLFWIRNSAFVWTRGKIIPQRLDLRTPKKTLGSIMHASQYIFIFLGIAIFPVVASKPYHILAWFVLYRHIHHPWNQKSYPCEFPKNTNPDKAVAWNPFTFIKINPFPPRSLTICQYQHFVELTKMTSSYFSNAIHFGMVYTTHLWWWAPGDGSFLRHCNRTSPCRPPGPR